MAISTLAVNLVARTSVFERRIKKSKLSLYSLQKQTARNAQSLVRFAKGALVAAGVGGLGFMIKRTMESMDATAKLSDRIGIATEKLIGLRHAAEIAGVANDALDKSLEIFVRRMGEVKSGSGEATRGLEALGLSADELISKMPDQSLMVIADRINDLGTQAEKSAAAYFLFGRSGAQMLNLFATGADGIAAAQAEAERLGLTFSRIDAAKVEAANDAMTRLKGVLTGVAQTLAIELSPIIDAVAVKFTDMGTNGENAGQRIKASFAGIGKTLAVTMDWLVGIRGVLQIIVGVVQKGLSIALHIVLGAVEKVVRAIADLNNMLAKTKIGEMLGITEIDLSGFIDGLNSAMTTFDEAATKNVEAGAKRVLSGVFGESVKAYDRLIAEANAKAKAVQDALNKQPKGPLSDPEAGAALAKLIDDAERLKESLKSPEQKLLDIRERYAEMLGEGLIGTDEFDKGMAAAREKMLGIKDQAAARDIGAGSFQEIRSEFIDVAALNPSAQDPQVDRQITLAEENNRLLEKMVQQDMGTYQV